MDRAVDDAAFILERIDARMAYDFEHNWLVAAMSSKLPVQD